MTDQPLDPRLLELMRIRVDEGWGPITNDEGELLLIEVERLRDIINQPKLPVCDCDPGGLCACLTNGTCRVEQKNRGEMK